MSETINEVDTVEIGKVKPKKTFFATLTGIFGSGLGGSRGTQMNLGNGSYYCSNCGRSINGRDRKARRNHPLPCKKEPIR